MVIDNSEYFLNLKIYPNKSLTLITLIVFSVIFFLTTVFASLYFFLLGAWPVSIFLLIDFGLVFYAFNSYKVRSRIYDRIILNNKLLVINVNKDGSKVKKIIEPTWLRLKVYSDRKKQYLSIISKGKCVKVGEFLNVNELVDLAKEVKKGLIKRERYLTFNS